MKSDPSAKLLIEGHCDERGTEEYNRALGERRALALREDLAKAGIDAERMRTISYGKGTSPWKPAMTKPLSGQRTAVANSSSAIPWKSGMQ